MYVVPTIGHPCAFWSALVYKILAVLWFIYLGFTQSGLDLVKSRMTSLALAMKVHLNDGVIGMLMALLACFVLGQLAEMVIAHYAVRSHAMCKRCTEFQAGSKMVEFVCKRSWDSPKGMLGGWLLMGVAGICVRASFYDVCFWILFVFPLGASGIFSQLFVHLLIHNAINVINSDVKALTDLLGNNFGTEAAESAEFWMEATQWYTALELQFQKVFIEAKVGYMVLTGNLLFFVSAVLIGCIAATGDKGGITIAFALGTIGISMTFIGGFWSLAKITDNVMSTRPGRRSIHRYALDHSGRIKSVEAAVMHAQLLHVIGASRAAVELPGLGVINTSLLTTIMKLLPVIVPVLLRYIRGAFS